MSPLSHMTCQNYKFPQSPPPADPYAGSGLFSISPTCCHWPSAGPNESTQYVYDLDVGGVCFLDGQVWHQSNPPGLLLQGQPAICEPSSSHELEGGKTEIQNPQVPPNNNPPNRSLFPCFPPKIKTRLGFFFKLRRFFCHFL